MKIISIYIIRCIFRLFYVFNVKPKRIVFYSFSGKQYSCSPKYISEYLEKNYPGVFEMVWLIRNPKEFNFLCSRGIKVVKYFSLKRFFYEATAEYNIINTNFCWLPHRKGQCHINTWHGGGCYKKVDFSGNKMHQTKFKLNAKSTDFYIASCELFKINEIRKSWGYFGKTLDIGMPRNDILFSDDGVKVKIRKKILEDLNVNLDKVIVLYAPTWRDNRDDNIEMPNFSMIQKVLKSQGKECEILFRVHHKSKQDSLMPGIIDVSDNVKFDMQELLIASDILITDYSSSIWDYSILCKPCFLFVPDLDEYKKYRGFYVDIYKWGFFISKNNEELKQQLSDINMDDIKTNMNMHQKSFGSFENGTACKSVAKLFAASIK